MKLNLNEKSVGFLSVASLVTSLVGSALTLLYNMAVTERNSLKIHDMVEKEVKKALEK